MRSSLAWPAPVPMADPAGREEGGRGQARSQWWWWGGGGGGNPLGINVSFLVSNALSMKMLRMCLFQDHDPPHTHTHSFLKSWSRSWGGGGRGASKFTLAGPLKS